MRDYVIIYINGRREVVRGDRLFQSLSDFLRYDRQLVGTKVVCAEGDCGSCCVLIGEPTNGKIAYRNVTSCIQYLYQLDGCHVITVEGLKVDGKLSCVQESMVTCQGSQCGYCTPGFVVSMHAMLETRPKLTEPDMRLGLSGNLCRCTGYEAIMKAGVDTDIVQLRRANDLYPPGKLLSELQPACTESVRVEHAGKVFFKPTSVTEAVAFKAANLGCLLIAGGTDLGVVMNKGKLTPTVVMSLAGLSTLRKVAQSGGSLTIGALVTLAETEAACEAHLPEMSRLLRRHGSPPIRNAGTLAGNIANGSPIGDTMPGLYVLNGEIELTGAKSSRRININDFYTGYRKTVMAADELITAVHIPLPAAGDVFRLYKISKRFDLDISTFSAAFWMKSSGGVIESIRIACGGVGANILRLKKIEAILTGKPISDTLIDQAADLMGSEMTPISDVRGGKDYRLLLGANVLRKFFAEFSGEPATLAAASGNGNGHLTNGKGR
ncbi:xanthine dehydrogenase small subunit [soil metagenome]